MKKYNLLLLSSSNHIQLIESFREAYKILKLSGNIYTADLNSYCASSLASDKHFVIPRSDTKTYFKELVNIIKEYEINILLSARDEELLILSKNKKFFEEIGCNVIVSDYETIVLCRDKYELCKFFLNHNVPHPKTYNFQEIKNVEGKIDFKPHSRMSQVSRPWQRTRLWELVDITGPA